MFYQQLLLQRYFSRIFYIVTAVYLTISEFVDYFWNTFLPFYRNIFFYGNLTPNLNFHFNVLWYGIIHSFSTYGKFSGNLTFVLASSVPCVEMKESWIIEEAKDCHRSWICDLLKFLWSSIYHQRNI